ncbi:MAG: DMT family transporter [Ktedonobacteraceae bacterium]|nr:DMT family transporter [Ktedonobacteraceae bacterium]
MKMKMVAGIAFLLNTFLFATYYSVAKEALAHVDPIVFTFFVFLALVPAALAMIALSWQKLTREVLKSGALLGTCLCLGLITLAVALKHNSAAGTAFFPSLNGLIAAAISWLVLRQPIKRVTWFAGGVSVFGALLLIESSPVGGMRGAVIAFIGGLFCTLYIFLADHEQRDKKAHWALFGVELLTMAAWASLIALLFGDWQAVHPTAQDIQAILYIAFGTTFLPTLITVLCQNFLSPVTVSFIYILEPILGAVIAYVYLGETLPLPGYIGGSLVVAGALINTWGTAERPASRQARAMRSRDALPAPSASRPVRSLISLLACLVIGLFCVYQTGGFPPSAWDKLATLWLQRQSIAWPPAMPEVLLIAQALSWLTAWSALAGIACLLLYRALAALFTGIKIRKLSQRKQQNRQQQKPVQQPFSMYGIPAHARHLSLPALRETGSVAPTPALPASHSQWRKEERLLRREYVEQ